VYGFGDFSGTDKHNLELSELRANTVKEELVKNGVDENRLKIVALGKTQYFGTPDSFDNRRVMFAKD
jgi:outer membrane protein OmpA-like peptidoglycan-associated protein